MPARKPVMGLPCAIWLTDINKKENICTHLQCRSLVSFLIACIMKPALACPFSSRFICIMPFRHHLETLRLIAPDTPARGQRNNHGHDPLMRPMARDGFTVKPEWFHQEAL
ncbi:hypothetical protein HNW77_12875 [Komagataeibacter sp. AV436]|uniref:Uncharacterized protein n=2 Tax=Komagataeibacter melomenusus TaxID=2766578 RepID=A0ABX2AG78_9PROT|nr:hypothetical protein [Komagataeibacter melomenusus]MBV1831590.1 hypothetical protein [Komagataeibacter melomenusus]NPC67261.1 hypothetical protein [Komagataeibacter melomenusus]